MPGSNDNLRGVIHGRVIQLETDIGLGHAIAGRGPQQF